MTKPSFIAGIMIIYAFVLAPLGWLFGPIIGKVYAHIVLAIRKHKAAS